MGLGKEEFAEILMTAWNRIQPSWLQRGFILSGIHTPNGIDRHAIKEEQLDQFLPYSDDGIILLELTEEELKELDFPDEDPTISFMHQKFIDVLQTRPPVSKSKRKISKNIHFLS